MEQAVKKQSTCKANSLENEEQIDNQYPLDHLAKTKPVQNCQGEYCKTNS
jgi:hypothetical protein